MLTARSAGQHDQMLDHCRNIGVKIQLRSTRKQISDTIKHRLAARKPTLYIAPIAVNPSTMPTSSVSAVYATPAALLLHAGMLVRLCGAREEGEDGADVGLQVICRR